MRQVVKGATRGPLLGQSSCMTVKMEDGSYSSESTDSGITVEKERRLRREIANSNERRRMQSINLGYQSLRSMLPLQRETATNGAAGEKLSKAAVLQHAAEYIERLLKEREQLMLHNSELSKALNRQTELSPAAAKRRKRDTESSSDEGISMSFPSQPDASADLVDELRRESAELRVQLERERQRRAYLEQSYTYLMAAAQVAPPVPCRTHDTINPVYEMSTPTADIPPRSDLSTSHCVAADAAAAAAHQQSFGKASSVASQNLSIIVEAINHLEGDTRASPAQSDKEQSDSAVSSAADFSDDNKSESGSEAPPPPPAHQSPPTHLTGGGYPAAYGSYHHAVAAGSLMYRPTFLATQTSVIVSPGGSRNDS